jgi:hypothetical protein
MKIASAAISGARFFDVDAGIVFISDFSSSDLLVSRCATVTRELREPRCLGFRLAWQRGSRRPAVKQAAKKTRNVSFRKAGLARGICFFLRFAGSRSLPSLGMTSK